MKKRIWWNVVCGVLMLNSSVFAQDNMFDANVTEEKVSLFERGGVGTIGTSLSRVANYVSLNGFVNSTVSYNDEEFSFYQNELNLLVTSHLNDRLSAEFNLEIAENGSSVGVEYMFADYKISKAAILRIGKFLLPTGDFNEYIEIPFINKLINEPLTTFVSPSEWTDVGIELRGRLKEDNQSFVPYYALALTNGLQEIPEPEMEEEEEEEGLSADNNKSKAISAQFGVEYLNNFNTSVFYHYSRYDSAASLGFTVFGSSFSYNNDKLSFYGEYQSSIYDEFEETAALDDEETESAKGNGFYLQGGYKINKIEPVVRYDYTKLGGDEEIEANGLTFGLNYYVGQKGIVKMNYSTYSIYDENENTFNAAFVLTF